MTRASHAVVGVIGANGFLGRALVEGLQSGGTPVATYTRSAPCVDHGVLEPRLATAQTIVWAASRINPLVATQHPDLVRQDREDFQQFVTALRPAGCRARIVLLSSGGTVYGAAAQPPHTEATPPQPTSAYGRAKLALEHLLLEHSPGAVVVRIANAYGPGQPAAPGQGVIGHWLRSLARDEPVTVFGDLSTERDYVFVDDVVSALTAITLSDGPLPSRINVGSGAPTSLSELLEVIHDIVGDRRLKIAQEEARPFDLASSWLDVQRARQALGWVPRVSLHDGVVSMWRWISAG